MHTVSAMTTTIEYRLFLVRHSINSMCMKQKNALCPKSNLINTAVESTSAKLQNSSMLSPIDIPCANSGTITSADRFNAKYKLAPLFLNSNMIHITTSTTYFK